MEYMDLISKPVKWRMDIKAQRSFNTWKERVSALSEVLERECARSRMSIKDGRFLYGELEPNGNGHSVIDLSALAQHSLELFLLTKEAYEASLWEK